MLLSSATVTDDDDDDKDEDDHRDHKALHERQHDRLADRRTYIATCGQTATDQHNIISLGSSSHTVNTPTGSDIISWITMRWLRDDYYRCRYFKYMEIGNCIS